MKNRLSDTESLFYQYVTFEGGRLVGLERLEV